MATITITTDPVTQDPRLQAAFTDLLKPVDVNGNPRQANAADVKTWLVGQMRMVVQNYEHRAAEAAIVNQDFSPS